MPQLRTSTAADALVDGLLAQGVRTAFAVAGESYLPVLDALYAVRERLRLVTCRHEANAANMAEATGKLTGRPGVCLVTRGPGALHAAIALHTADQDGTPLLLLVGQVDRRDRGRGAFQELDLGAVFGSIAKAVIDVGAATDIGPALDRAYRLSLEGRPGPVVIGLPEDLLTESAGHPLPVRYDPPPQEPPPAAVAAVLAALGEAKRPLLWLGGSPWSDAGTRAVAEFARAWKLPVVTGFRRRDLFPNTDPHYVGELGFAVSPTLLTALHDADLLLAIGAELGDVETGGYERLDPAGTATRLCHFPSRDADLGRVFPPRLGGAVSPDALARALARAPVASAPSWDGWRQWLRAGYLATLAPLPVQGAVNLSDVFLQLRQRLPLDSIVTNGAGNYAAWLHRLFQHDLYGTQLAPRSGAMGYGLPAGIAAALQHPDRRVVTVAGDGCFAMAQADLITAATLRCRLLVLVVNNGSFGTIRMHQEARFPGRVHGTDLTNPCFVALAGASGIPGRRVVATAEFPAALHEALATDGPYLIELVTDIRDIAPGRTLPAGQR